MPQPELLASVLSHLPMKDLARIITVSKHWKQTIAGVAKLQLHLIQQTFKTRKLYFGWEDAKSQSGPFITREFNENTKQIVEAHPALLKRWVPHFGYSDPDNCMNLVLPLIEDLKAVPASTLLFQPPLEAIEISSFDPAMEAECDDCIKSLRRTGGLVFGDVIEAYENLREWASNVFVMDDTHPGYDLSSEKFVFLWFEEAVLNKAPVVVEFQETLARLANAQP